MNCPIKTQEDREWLLEYAAGRLDKARAALVEQHLEACSDCAQFVAGQRVVWEALDRWESPDLSADFNRRLYHQIDQGRPASWLERVFRPLWRPIVPLAATCLLIVAGIALHTPGTPVNSHESQAKVEVVEPEQVERTLDDLQMLRELSLAPQTEANSPQPM